MTDVLTAINPILADIADRARLTVRDAYHNVDDAGIETFTMSVTPPRSASMAILVPDVISASAAAGLRTTAICEIDGSYLVVASNGTGQLQADIRDCFDSTLKWTTITS